MLNLSVTFRLVDVLFQFFVLYVYILTMNCFSTVFVSNELCIHTALFRYLAFWPQECKQNHSHSTNHESAKD